MLCWKMAPAYCQAVLSYDQRIVLDSAPAESADVEAKELAAKYLEERAARKSSRKAAKPKASAEVKPRPAPAARPTETPEQLRVRVRASLLRESA